MYLLNFVTTFIPKCVIILKNCIDKTNSIINQLFYAVYIIYYAAFKLKLHLFYY